MADSAMNWPGPCSTIGASLLKAFLRVIDTRDAGRRTAPAPSCPLDQEFTSAPRFPVPKRRRGSISGGPELREHLLAAQFEMMRQRRQRARAIHHVVGMGTSITSGVVVRVAHRELCATEAASGCR